MPIAKKGHNDLERHLKVNLLYKALHAWPCVYKDRSGVTPHPEWVEAYKFPKPTYYLEGPVNRGHIAGDAIRYVLKFMLVKTVNYVYHHTLMPYYIITGNAGPLSGRWLLGSSGTTPAATRRFTRGLPPGCTYLRTACHGSIPSRGRRWSCTSWRRGTWSPTARGIRRMLTTSSSVARQARQCCTPATVCFAAGTKGMDLRRSITLTPWPGQPRSWGPSSKLGLFVLAQKYVLHYRVSFTV